MNEHVTGEALIHFRCDACTTQLTAPEALAGEAGPCPTCGAPVTAPLRPAPLSPPTLDEEPHVPKAFPFVSPAGVELECVLRPEKRWYRTKAIAACSAVLAGVMWFGWFMKTYGTFPALFRGAAPSTLTVAAAPDRTGAGWMAGTFSRPKSGLIVQQGRVILQLSGTGEQGADASVGVPCASLDAGRLARAIGDLSAVKGRARVSWSGGPREYRTLVVDRLEPMPDETADDMLAEWSVLRSFLNASTWVAAQPTIAPDDLPPTQSPPAGWDVGLLNRYATALVVPLAEVAMPDGHRTLWSARCEGVATTLQCVTERRKGEAFVRFAPRPSTGPMCLPSEPGAAEMPALAEALIRSSLPSSGASSGTRAIPVDRDGPDRRQLSLSTEVSPAAAATPAIQ